jgi:Tol biopolymer transport system component
MKRFIVFVAAATAALATMLSSAPSAGASAQNGRIAFRRYFNADHTRGAIFTIRPDGSGVRQITHRGKTLLDTAPNWSPDGRWIAFYRQAVICSCKPTRIFKVRADGTHLTQISRNPAFEDLLPAWSPNGKQIAFTRYDDSVGLVAVFVMRADGTHVHQVTPSNLNGTFPEWSPDGSRLVFEGGPAHRSAVWTIRLDGTHISRLTPWKLHAGDGPDWSPNGKWIVLESHADQDRTDNVYLVHPNGTDLHRITHTFDDTHWGSYSFSPDGRMITVSHSPGVGQAGNADIFVMNPDGSGLRNVTRSLIFDSAPDWGARPS